MTRDEARKLAELFAPGGQPVEAILAVAAVQRERDAEICRAVHRQSRQRTELALLCAMEIEKAGDDVKEARV